MALPGWAADGVLEIPIVLKGLVYDPLTEKLYGSATNDLFQIDPTTGAVLKSFPLGANVTYLSLGAGPGIWATIDGAHLLRRFDLPTLTAEESIPASFPISDIFASRTDPQQVAYSTDTITGSYSHAAVVRNGAVLPDGRTLIGLETIALQGNTLYLGRGSQIFRGTVGPNGISADLATQFSSTGGKIDILGTFIVKSSGDVLALQTLTTISNLPVAGTSRGVSVNEQDKSIYFAKSPIEGKLLLSKYAHPSLRLVGLAEVANINFDVHSSFVSWNSNFVALNTSSNLYILDTAKLFPLPAKLEIMQSVVPTSLFGSSVTFDVTITNSGTGVAINVTATNIISDGNQAHSPQQPLVQTWAYLAPGSAVTYPATFQPLIAGKVTNSVAVSASNDSLTVGSSSSVTTTITPIASPVSVLPFAPRLLAYDAGRKRLIFADNYNIWALDVAGSRLHAPEPIFESNFPVNALEVSPAGMIFAYRTWSANGEIETIDPDTLELVRYFGVGGGFVDLAPSPTDTNILFVADARGGVLFKGRAPLPNALSYSPRAEFASSGANLYAMDPQTCAIQIFSVSDAGLTLLRTQPIDTCSDFKQLGGLLYFDSGIIFDPEKGEKLTNSLKLNVASLVVPRENGVLDVIERTAGQWSVRRVNAARQEIRRVHLDLSAPPLQAVVAGDNRIALRTTQPGLHLVDLDPRVITGHITNQGNGQLLLTFDTAPSQRYRFEKTSDLGTNNWIAAGAEFVADSSIAAQTVSVADSTTLFFRIVQLAP